MVQLDTVVHQTSLPRPLKAGSLAAAAGSAAAEQAVAVSDAGAAAESGAAPVAAAGAAAQALCSDTCFKVSADCSNASVGSSCSAGRLMDTVLASLCRSTRRCC